MRLLTELTRRGREKERSRDGDRTVIVLEVPLSVFGNNRSGDREVHVTVEVDPEGRIRELRHEAEDGKPGGTAIRYDDFGLPVEAAPPPAEEVTEIGDVTRGGKGPAQLACAMQEEQYKKLLVEAEGSQRELVEMMLTQLRRDCEDKG